MDSLEAEITHQSPVEAGHMVEVRNAKQFAKFFNLVQGVGDRLVAQ